MYDITMIRESLSSGEAMINVSRFILFLTCFHVIEYVIHISYQFMYQNKSRRKEHNKHIYTHTYSK